MTFFLTQHRLVQTSGKKCEYITDQELKNLEKKPAGKEFYFDTLGEMSNSCVRRDTAAWAKEFSAGDKTTLEARTR